MVGTIAMSIDSAVLKLVVTPALIAAASLAGRRWGQAVSGWFVGLPLTSGPVAFFLAIDQSPSFAAAAASGSLAGATAEAAFCVAYGRAAARWRWPAALAVACAAFAAAAVGIQRLSLPLIAMTPITLSTLIVALRLMPVGSEVPGAIAPPSWDIPARMVIATALVFAITAAAPAVGPRASGVLASFPVYAAILTIFAHRSGADPALRVLRGLLIGLFAFAGFFVVLGASLEPLGVGLAFGAAALAALVIQAVSYRWGIAGPSSATRRPRARTGDVARASRRWRSR
jgi:hypothetical protein